MRKRVLYELGHHKVDGSIHVKHFSFFLCDDF